MIAAELFKFNDCVEGEIKAVFVVSFLPKPVKCDWFVFRKPNWKL